MQTIKTALKAMCLGKQDTKDWDLELPWLLYGCSAALASLPTSCCMHSSL